MLFSRALLLMPRRDRRAARRHGKAPPGLRVEQLERREVMAAAPVWVEQGPGPVSPPSTSYGKSVGAINAVAVNPADAGTVVVATVNGGLWKGEHAGGGPGGISWRPLTDDQPSLAIGDVAYSPADPTGRTILAGTGQFSSYQKDGGSVCGILRSVDGGARWQVIGRDEFSRLSIRRVLPTSDPKVIFVAAERFTLNDPQDSGGVYRSTDGGATFTVVDPRLAGRATDVIADPARAGRFYAAVCRRGIFRSDDFGTTWKRIDDAAGAKVGGVDTAVNVRLALSGGPGRVSRLYVGVVTNETGELAKGRLQGVYQAQVPVAGSAYRWRQVGATPQSNDNGQGQKHFALAVDPTVDGVVYVGGEDPGVWVYRPQGNAWTPLAETPAVGGSAPHPDTRSLVFIGGALWSANDGGVYRLTHAATPRAGRDAWVSMNGAGSRAIGNIEMTSLAYDPVNRVFFGGLQDNGTVFQATVGSRDWKHTLGGDGYTQGADTASQSPLVVRYSASNNFSGFVRRVFGPSNTEVRPIERVIANLSPAYGYGRAIVVTTPTHGLVTGDRIVVVGVRGNPAANDTFTVRVLDPNRFMVFSTGLVPTTSTPAAPYSGGGTWWRAPSITRISGAADQDLLVVSPRHRLRTGDQITITDTGDGNLDGSGFLVNVVDENRFRLAGTATPEPRDTTFGGAWARSNVVMLKRAIGELNLSGLNKDDLAVSLGGGIRPFFYVFNSVAPGRMLLGLNGVYESKPARGGIGQPGDLIDDLSRPAAEGGTISLPAGEFVTALAYGGRRVEGNKVIDAPDVAYVGTTINGGLFYRGEAGGTFTRLSGDAPGQLPPIGDVTAIAADPQDWRRVYVVLRAESFYDPIPGWPQCSIWMANDVTNLQAPGNGFVPLNGNIMSLAISGQLNRLALFDDTPMVAGDSIPIVGGLGGVFVPRTPLWAPDEVTWGRIGDGLPNAFITSLSYVDHNGGMLAVATLGRGAWKLGDVARAIRPRANASGMEVVVRTPTGDRIPLDVSASTTIDDIRVQIQRATAIPPARQKLIFAGKVLEDGRILSDYNIQRGSVLHLVVAGRDRKPDAVRPTRGGWTVRGVHCCSTAAP